MLEVNEIFGPTIQGEGKLVGNLSIFIRFGKCNFKCVGFNVEYETPSGVKSVLVTHITLLIWSLKIVGKAMKIILI